MVHITGTFVALLAAAIVLAPAISGFGRPAHYAWVGFLCIIGGGLIDPESTTPAFRERYLRIIRESALPYLWPQQREKVKVVPASLGELSQAIGAALIARYTTQAKA